MGRVLALDPGALFGWAWSDDGQVDLGQVGVWDLGLRAVRGGNHQQQRAQKLANHLAAIGPEVVVYEDIGGFEGLGGSHVSTFVNMALAWCSRLAVPTRRIYRVEIKRHATGCGHCSDRELIEAAHRKLGYRGHDENEAHALWVLDSYFKRLPG